MGFITQQGLVNLKAYKYVSGGRTFFDNLLNPWWEFVTTILPISMAPNLVTLVGLVINMAGALMYLFYDTAFRVPLPAWMYFITTACAFTYQTLDAVDGKQARRTGTSSPLGQLFDHGCDAVNMFFGLLGFCQIARTGTSWEFFILVLSLTTTFYTQQWEEYHTHVFRTCIGNWGVTEGILMQISYLLAVSITGGALAEWKMQEILPFIPMPEFIGSLRAIQVGAISILYNAVTYSYVNVKAGLASAKCTQMEALAGLLPIPLFWLELFIVFQTEWAWANPAYVLLLTFPSYCLMTCKHIVCSVCKMDFEPFQKSPFLFLLFLVNRYALLFVPSLKAYQVDPSLGTLLVPDSYVALVIFTLTLVSFSVFVVRVIGQITQFLDINCLTIKKKIQ